MLDLFCGRFSVGRTFAERGWRVTGVDIVRPDVIPDGCSFLRMDVLLIGWRWIKANFDFVWASSVCDGFASFGMKHFRPNPPYPTHELLLFNHTRQICTEADIPFAMENVRAAQQFVGPAVNHCGPFYLWGNAVPPILPQGITKAKWRPNSEHGRSAPGNFAPELNLPKAERKAKLATIPPELSNCVATFAERLLESKAQ
jgi:hypothetical protein